MSKPVIKYKVVGQTDITYLEKQVNREIEQGWEPVGPMLFTPADIRHQGLYPFFQTMVCREHDKEEAK